MAKYGQQDVTFPSTREAKFVNSLTEAVDAGDKEAFTAAVFEYDQVRVVCKSQGYVCSSVQI